MLKFKLNSVGLMVFACTFMLVSCSKEDEIISSEDNLSVEDTLGVAFKTGSTSNTNSPWDTDSSYLSIDKFEVDPDGGGAHGYTESEWDSNPTLHGFNIRKYCYGDGGVAVLTCPNGSGSKRAEYSDGHGIDLDKENRQDLTFTIVDYNNSSELIMAQLHNKNSERPYLTISAESGEIKLKRSETPIKGSATTTSSFTLPFEANDTYRIRFISNNGSRTVQARIKNEDTGEEAKTNFGWRSAWNGVDGDFFWKHGVYMPNGGSNDTAMRVQKVSFRTNK